MRYSLASRNGRGNTVVKETSAMRIGVVGLGAIGGWVGARLALGGQAVSALMRDGAVEDSSPLRLIEGGREEAAPIRRSADADALGVQDVLLIAVKAPALAEAAERAAPMIGPQTLIVPMLNGVPWWFAGGERLASVDPDGRIAAALPLAQVVGCVVHAAVERRGDGAVMVRNSNGAKLGEPGGGASARVDALAAMFTTAGIEASVEADIRRAIWYKLWGNMTFNPVSALTLATTDRILDSDVRAFVLACMAEAAAIGAAVGCPIAESGAERLAVAGKLGAFRTSMLQDVEAGRAIELEALVGAPRELARRAGVACPNIDALYALTRLMAESRGLVGTL
jgi:2-dehydropantoate 2-reductase